MSLSSDLEAVAPCSFGAGQSADEEFLMSDSIRLVRLLR
jgi:hypothetical protein